MIDSGLQANHQEQIDIYSEHIIPMIQSCQKGSRILFVTPSTFFGYYSNGAATFIKVCTELENAKRRGVEIKLVVDIHDLMSAKAAQGLLTLLREGQEIRNLTNNSSRYYLLTEHEGAQSQFLQMIVGPPFTNQYLPDIRIRPYAKEGVRFVSLADEGSRSKRQEFYEDWERCSTSVSVHVKQLLGGNWHHRLVSLLQISAFVAYLSLGLILGALISSQPSLSSDISDVVTWLLLTLLVGVISSVAAQVVLNRITDERREH